LKPRWTSQWRGRRAGPRGAGGSGLEGSKSSIILAARWPSVAARQRRSSRCRRRRPLSAPLWATGPPFLWSALTTKSRSRPDSSCGSGGGCGCKGRQGFPVMAPLRAAAFVGHWRRRR
jgi:hypothetical protein